MTDSDVTLLLAAARGGDRDADEQLYERIYGELRGLARSRLRHERDGHTLQTTALVNEAYLRLVQGEPNWKSRAHFFGAAVEAMRRVLIEHARKRARKKRGDDPVQVTFADLDVRCEEPDLDLLALDGALTELEKVDGRLSRLVHLRYFGGFSIRETAEVLETSPATVKRDWVFARTWLRERMAGSR